MFLAAMLFVASLAALIFGFVHQAWPSRRNTYPFSTIALSLSGIGLLAVLFTLANHYYVLGKLEHLARVWGYRPEWAWAVTLLAAGGLSFFVGRSFSLSSPKRFQGFLGVGAMVAAYFLLLIAGTRDDVFTVDGDSNVCVAWDESGVRRYPSQQIDRPTGRPCVLVTAENRDELAPMLGKSETTPQRKEHGPFFSSRSYADGPVPLAWYSRADEGAIELWDRPGYNPDTGARLKLITPAIIKEREQQRRANPNPNPNPSQTAANPALISPGNSGAAAVKPAGEAPHVARGADPAQLLRDRYTVPMPATSAGVGPRWALLAWTAEGTLDPRLSAGVADVARFAGLPPPRQVFNTAFAQEHVADRVLAGDASVLAQMQLAQTVDYVALARIEQRRQPDRGPETLKAVDFDVRVQFLRLSDLSASSPLKVSEGASGYDYEIAGERAYGLVLEKLTPGLTPILRGFLK